MKVREGTFSNDCDNAHQQIRVGDTERLLRTACSWMTLKFQPVQVCRGCPRTASWTTLWRKVKSEWPSWGDQRLSRSRPENKGGGEDHTADGVPSKKVPQGRYPGYNHTDTTSRGFQRGD